MGDAVWASLSREQWKTTAEIAESIPRGRKDWSVQRSMVLKHLRSLERYAMAECRMGPDGQLRWRRIRWGASTTLPTTAPTPDSRPSTSSRRGGWDSTSGT